MAINISSTNRKRHRFNLRSEINVTPLVDIMLVLLIVFMVTSPMLVSGIQIDLPETKSSAVQGQDEPLVITIDKQGDLYLFNTKIEKETLTEKLNAITKEKKDSRIFVRGDKSISYGDIVNLIASIQSAGFFKVALVSNIKHNDK